MIIIDRELSSYPVLIILLIVINLLYILKFWGDSYSFYEVADLGKYNTKIEGVYLYNLIEVFSNLVEKTCDYKYRVETEYDY